MTETAHTLPERFVPAYDSVARLARHERYIGAFVFGSIVRGTTTPHSDFDVNVVVDDLQACQQINHPFINSVKLDLTFRSLAQLRAAAQDELKLGERMPMIGESLIIFDKTGALSELKAQMEHAQPYTLRPSEYQFQQFMMHHATDKAQRRLESDPLAALLVLHTSFNELLHLHYQIRGRWWLSNKWLLDDLRAWDQPLAVLVERFVATSDAQPKFDLWIEMLDYVLQPIGGRQPIAENTCDCPRCVADLAALLDE